MLSRSQFAAWLACDERDAFPFEFVSDEERATRRLLPPHTNLGSGRGRFWELMQRVEPLLGGGASVIDIGAYPATMLRLIRALPAGRQTRLDAAGFGFSEAFRHALDALEVNLLEMEFDARRPPAGPDSHILTRVVADPYDVAVCTEVIEHQLQPLVLCAGINRLLKPGGTLFLTTNSAGFIGDLVKLASGRHNVETLERSHVLADHDWRPHMRLYTLAEIEQILSLCGFRVDEGFYFDNGNVYAGAKGLATAALRRAAGLVPHMRSHLWVTARKVGKPSPLARERIEHTCAAYGVPIGETLAAGA